MKKESSSSSSPEHPFFFLLSNFFFSCFSCFATNKKSPLCSGDDSGVTQTLHSTS